ncbi:MAG: HAD-IA family hydrolase, partial [Cyanobacteria bacterium P01_G01_bin.49]
ADSTLEVQKFVSNHQLQQYIDLSQGVDGKMFKPDPQLYIQACQTLGVTPETTVMVGDSSLDIQMAQAAGAAGAIGVNRQPNLMSLAGDRVVSNLSEIQVL